MEDDDDREKGIKRQLANFEAKLDESSRACNVNVLHERLQALKERPAARGVGSITSLHRLYMIIHNEHERKQADFEQGYNSDPLLRYFDWYLEYIDFHRELKHGFDELIYVPLKLYFMDKRYVTPLPGRTNDGRSSSLQTSRLLHSTGNRADFLNTSNTDMNDLKDEFEELADIYENNEIQKLSGQLHRLNNQWAALLDYETVLHSDMFEIDLPISTPDGESPNRDISNVIRLVPDIIMKGKRSVYVAKKWIKCYGNRSQILEDKLRKLATLQEKMSAKLVDIHKDIQEKEKKLEATSQTVDWLLKREDRSDDINLQMYDTEQNLEKLRAALDHTKKEKRRLAREMLDSTHFEKDTLTLQKLQYEENKLKRYILERKIKSGEYQQRILESDLSVELDVKPSIIRFSNDAQEKYEQLEKDLDQKQKLKRKIEQALVPLQSDREVLDSRLNGKDEPSCLYSPSFLSSKSMSLGTPDSVAHTISPFPAQRKHLGPDSPERPIIQELSSVAAVQAANAVEDESNIVEEENDDSNPTKKQEQLQPPVQRSTKKKQPKPIERPAWQHTYKPKTLGKQQLPKTKSEKIQEAVDRKLAGKKPDTNKVKTEIMSGSRQVKPKQMQQNTNSLKGQVIKEEPDEEEVNDYKPDQNAQKQSNPRARPLKKSDDIEPTHIPKQVIQLPKQNIVVNLQEQEEYEPLQEQMPLHQQQPQPQQKKHQQQNQQPQDNHNNLDTESPTLINQHYPHQNGYEEPPQLPDHYHLQELDSVPPVARPLYSAQHTASKSSQSDPSDEQAVRLHELEQERRQWQQQQHEQQQLLIKQQQQLIEQQQQILMQSQKLAEPLIKSQTMLGTHQNQQTQQQEPQIQTQKHQYNPQAHQQQPIQEQHQQHKPQPAQQEVIQQVSQGQQQQQYQNPQQVQHETKQENQQQTEQRDQLTQSGRQRPTHGPRQQLPQNQTEFHPQHEILEAQKQGRRKPNGHPQNDFEEQDDEQDDVQATQRSERQEVWAKPPSLPPRNNVASKLRQYGYADKDVRQSRSNPNSTDVRPKSIQHKPVIAEPTIREPRRDQSPIKTEGGPVRAIQRMSRLEDYVEDDSTDREISPIRVRTSTRDRHTSPLQFIPPTKHKRSTKSESLDSFPKPKSILKKDDVGANYDRVHKAAPLKDKLTREAAYPDLLPEPSHKPRQSQPKTKSKPAQYQQEPLMVEVLQRRSPEIRRSTKHNDFADDYSSHTPPQKPTVKVPDVIPKYKSPFLADPRVKPLPNTARNYIPPNQVPKVIEPSSPSYEEEEWSSSNSSSNSQSSFSSSSDSGNQKGKVRFNDHVDVVANHSPERAVLKSTLHRRPKGNGGERNGTNTPWYQKANVYE